MESPISKLDDAMDVVPPETGNDAPASAPETPEKDLPNNDVAAGDDGEEGSGKTFVQVAPFKFSESQSS